MNAATGIALLAIIAGPLGAYLVASRKLSGKIGTSEASDLWAESSAMRSDYRNQIQALEKRVAQLADENEALRRQVATLNSQLSALAAKSKEPK